MTGQHWTKEQLAAYRQRRGAQRPVVGAVTFGPGSFPPDPTASDHGRDSADTLPTFPPPPTAQQIADWRNGVDRMNKTERAYSEYLTTLGLPWHFEAIKLKLAKKTYYTPDFYLPSRAEFREVKGFWRDDARAKFKLAADLFPWWRFTAIRKGKNGWEDAT